MNVYHGSYIEISSPDIEHSRLNVDFGKGFYVTPIYEQAEKWCDRFKRRSLKGIISKYRFAKEDCGGLNILEFKEYSEQWLDFIISCRSGIDNSDYDIVIGGVANDKVFNTVELYFDNLIDKNEAIKRLRYEKPNLQICFRTTKALEYLTFEGSEEI